VLVDHGFWRFRCPVTLHLTAIARWPVLAAMACAVAPAFSRLMSATTTCGAILSERLGDCFSNSLRASGYDGNFTLSVESILNPSFQFASLVMKSDEPGCAQPEICDVYSLFVCK